MSKFMKALIPFMLVLALLIASVPAFADAVAPSATPIVIAKVAVARSTYNGSVQTPKVVVRDVNGKEVSAEYYNVNVTGTAKNAGKYLVTVTGKAPYVGTASNVFIIHKAKNPYTLSANLKSNGQKTFTVSVSGAKEGAKVSVVKAYHRTRKGITVSGRKVTVPAGIHGWMKVIAKSSETKNYKATTKFISVRIG